MVDNKFNILVVDDEQDVRDYLGRGLNRRGYYVIEASSAEEGIEQVRNNDVDLVLLDVKLPNMEGSDALGEMRKIHPEIEAIMITGHGTIESATECMKKGAYDYVEKPLSIEKIVLMIEKALEKHQLKEMVALYEISKAIFSTIEMNDLLEIIVDLTMRVLQADDTSVMLFDEQNRLYIAISYGLEEQIQKETRLAVGERIAGWAAEYKQSLLLINGLKNDYRFEGVRGREEIKSSLVVPLLKNDKLLGILTVNRMRIPNNFNKADLYKANIFASLVSLALDNANLYKEFKKAQEQVVKINAELLSSVIDLRKMNADLQNSQRQLVQSTKMAALGRLVADMAHEVNNPLMIISGRAQLSLMEEIKNEKVRNNIEIMLEESLRAKDVMQRLLRFSRPSKGELGRVNINTSIAGLVPIIKPQFEMSGITIRTDFSETPLFVLIEEKHIQEALLNILNNAKDAINGKGEIVIATRAEADFARIDIKDSGCGMPQDVMDRIFDPFFTTKEKGTGLGLSVCYSIIKDSNGNLRFSSSPGEGTTATILLPLDDKGEK
ncbi:MAG: response regulator [Candidatus Omnitrophica bacterium]|nr:response regulator [Candidatus Omnitrophota bacterium]